ncbi:MAG TPA: PmoA family protein [Chitinophagaceae bacterium]|nr:PmoA family protein [Chitinophagaceae bacterium]
MKKYFAILMACSTTYVYAQKIKIESIPSQQKAVITINGKPFTQFNYPDSLPKPFLWPIIAAGGENITRGFPIQPRANEPIDHPHHIGLWLNYENVNGIDFWNNSYAIPAAEKSKYGHIQNVNITSIKNESYTSLGFATDVAIGYHHPKSNWTFAAIVRNAGVEMKPYIKESGRQKLPIQLDISFSKRFKKLPLTLSVTAHNLQT